MPDAYETDVQLDKSILLPQSASTIKWIPNPEKSVFAAIFWDKTVRIFEVQKEKSWLYTEHKSIKQNIVKQLKSVPLSLCWGEGHTSIYIGCADGSINEFDVEKQVLKQKVEHKGNCALNGLHYDRQKKMVICTSYSPNICMFSRQLKPILNVTTQHKIYASDFKKGLLAGATENQYVFVSDLNKIMLGGQINLFKSQVGQFSQLDVITINQEGSRLGYGSVDGRCNLSIIKSQYDIVVQPKISCWKASIVQQSARVLYPINSFQFHPKFKSWIMTASSSGIMKIWDPQSTNLIATLQYDQNPICCAAVSPCGLMIAYANGNDWHQGQHAISKWKNRIGVHVIKDSQIINRK